jgi:short-subunit dehydrogenase
MSQTDSATVLITGASSGIGRAFAHLFARDGCNLVLVARRETVLEELASELTRQHKARVTVIAIDLADPVAALRLHEQLRRDGVVVDVLVNNAGFGAQGAFAGLPLERQLQMIHLNVTALTALTRLLLPSMLERGRGGILNVGSTAAFQPGPFMAVYYATKAYVVSFSEALADELSGSGLRVSCLAPGPTATAFAAEAGAAESRLFEGETMTADEVARIGYEGWKQGTPLVIAGAGNRWRAFLVRLAPRAWVRKAVRDLHTPAPSPRPPTP